MSIPVKGTVLSSSPFTLAESSKFLKQFLRSDVLPEEGLLRGYLTSVAHAVEEGVARAKSNKQTREEFEQRGHCEVDGGGGAVKVPKPEGTANGGEDFVTPRKRKDKKVDGAHVGSGAGKKDKKRKKKEYNS